MLRCRAVPAHVLGLLPGAQQTQLAAAQRKVSGQNPANFSPNTLLHSLGCLAPSLFFAYLFVYFSSQTVFFSLQGVLNVTFLAGVKSVCGVSSNTYLSGLWRPSHHYLTLCVIFLAADNPEQNAFWRSTFSTSLGLSPGCSLRVWVLKPLHCLVSLGLRPV